MIIQTKFQKQQNNDNSLYWHLQYQSVSERNASKQI